MLGLGRPAARVIDLFEAMMARGRFVASALAELGGRGKLRHHRGADLFPRWC